MTIAGMDEKPRSWTIAVPLGVAVLLVVLLGLGIIADVQRHREVATEVEALGGKVLWREFGFQSPLPRIQEVTQHGELKDTPEASAPLVRVNALPGPPKTSWFAYLIDMRESGSMPTAE